MGGRLSDVSPNARLCLYVMALNAHDTGTNDAPPRTYFRGWQHLASAALGRLAYDRADEEAVRRAVVELARVGYVKPVGRRNQSRHGHAMYEINV